MLDGVKVLYRRVKKYEKRICIKSKGGSTLFEHLFQLPPAGGGPGVEALGNICIFGLARAFRKATLAPQFKPENSYNDYSVVLL